MLEPKTDSARSFRPGLALPLGPQFAADLKFPDEGQFKRIGIIGLDTSHVAAFTSEFNPMHFPDPKDKNNQATEPSFLEPAVELVGFRVTAAYPKGSPDIETSTARVPEFIAKVKQHNVKIVDSIDDLVSQVDYVLLETNDGRPHLEQVLPVLRAAKPVFVDKPVAGNLAEAIAIYDAARHYKTPLFTSSSLRFAPGAAAARNGAFGKGETFTSVEATGPYKTEPTHPDLYWYGIHGVEILFTAMGPGCVSVKRIAPDVVEGTWADGRKGTYRGSGTYGLSIQGEQKVAMFDVTKPYPKPAPPKPGDPVVRRPSLYFNLLVQIVEFYKSGKPPVSEKESLEIYAFMSAADESKEQGGKPVTLESVMTKARADAKTLLKGKLK
jgi:hypothetical protein